MQKETSKIFGKKMLSSVICLLVVLNIGTYIYFSQEAKKDKEGDLNGKYFLLNPARKFFGQEDLIINIQSIRDYLNEKYESDKKTSIYFEVLNTGANISINKDAEFFPASLLKLPVAMAVAKKIEKGEWKWTNELVLMRNDKDEFFGELYKESIGKAFTIELLVEKMLVESDNTAYHILLRNLEPKELNDIHDHLGLQDFFSNDGKISAKRYSIIFRSLYNSSYLSEENSQKILQFLAKTSFAQYLGSGLPQDVKFSHKIGISDEQQVVMDSGIVYATNRVYMLTVMMQEKDLQQAKSEMKDISEKIYNYIENYKGSDN